MVHRETIQARMPAQFRGLHPNTIAIIDASEMPLNVNVQTVPKREYKPILITKNLSQLLFFDCPSQNVENKD